MAVASPSAGTSPQTIAVTFNVADAGAGPLIALASPTKSFTATQGGDNPEAQTIAVSNGGGGTLNGLAANVSYGAGQPTGWLKASLNRNKAPATLTLTATTGTLTAGTYNATVAVTSGVASNSPQNVTVTFTVAPPAPTIVLSVPTLTFTAGEGGPDPAPQTVQVTSGTAGGSHRFDGCRGLSDCSTGRLAYGQPRFTHGAKHLDSHSTPQRSYYWDVHRQRGDSVDGCQQYTANRSVTFFVDPSSNAAIWGQFQH